MTGSAYHFLPPHTCYNQRVAAKSAWQCLFFANWKEVFVCSEEQMVEQYWKRTVCDSGFLWCQFLAEPLAVGVRGRLEIYMVSMLHGCVLLVQMQAALHKCAHMHVRTIKLSVCVCGGMWGLPICCGSMAFNP